MIKRVSKLALEKIAPNLSYQSILELAVLAFIFWCETHRPNGPFSAIVQQHSISSETTVLGRLC